MQEEIHPIHLTPSPAQTPAPQPIHLKPALLQSPQPAQIVHPVQPPATLHIPKTQLVQPQIPQAPLPQAQLAQPVQPPPQPVDPAGGVHQTAQAPAPEAASHSTASTAHAGAPARNVPPQHVSPSPADQLAFAPPFLPATDSLRWIVVSLPNHTMEVKQDGLVIARLVQFSTGRRSHLTPVLAHAVIDPERRYRQHHSIKYENAPMPFALFFSAECAFHQGSPTVESHGCIHLPHADAAWLFDWVGSNPVNVQIQGPQRMGPRPGLG